MGKIFVLVFIIFLLAIVWASPLYLIVNFVCWVFGFNFHLSLLQAFALCLLASMIKNLLFEKENV